MGLNQLQMKHIFNTTLLNESFVFEHSGLSNDHFIGI